MPIRMSVPTSIPMPKSASLTLQEAVCALKWDATRLEVLTDAEQILLSRFQSLATAAGPADGAPKQRSSIAALDAFAFQASTLQMLAILEEHQQKNADHIAGLRSALEAHSDGPTEDTEYEVKALETALEREQALAHRLATLGARVADGTPLPPPTTMCEPEPLPASDRLPDRPTPAPRRARRGWRDVPSVVNSWTAPRVCTVRELIGYRAKGGTLGLSSAPPGVGPARAASRGSRRPVSSLDRAPQLCPGSGRAPEAPASAPRPPPKRRPQSAPSTRPRAQEPRPRTASPLPDEFVRSSAVFLEKFGAKDPQPKAAGRNCRRPKRMWQKERLSAVQAVYGLAS